MIRPRKPFSMSLVAAASAVLMVGCGSTVPPSTYGSGTANVSGTAESGLAAPTAGAASGTTGSLPGVGGGTSGVGAGSGGTAPNAVATPVPTSTGAVSSGHVQLTAPLKIGLAYINNQSASSALGSQDPRTNSVKTVVEGFVRAINHAGGLDGRKLVPVEYEWHSGDGSWSTAAAEACARFTQDNHVTVVLDEAFGLVGGFRDCLQRAGVFDISNEGVGDDVSSATATLNAAVGGFTIDQQYGAVLRQEVRSGYLTAKNQIGIIVEGCPENERAYSRTLLPLIKSLGLAAPKTYSFNCVDSTAGGASQGQAAISNAILRFRQPPTVDRVMFVSIEEAAALLLFGASASSQDYHPGYLLSSNAEAHLAVESGSGFTPDQVPQIHGVGNQPTNDVNNGKPTTVDRRCLALLRAASVVPANYDDIGQAEFSCGPFLLLEALLGRTNGDADASSLAQAIGTLGTTFAAPGILDARTRYDSSHHDGGDLVQTFGYVASCQCIKYSGAPASAG